MKALAQVIIDMATTLKKKHLWNGECNDNVPKTHRWTIFGKNSKVFLVTKANELSKLKVLVQIVATSIVAPPNITTRIPLQPCNNLEKQNNKWYIHSK